MRALLARALRKSRFEVHEASTGTEALERLAKGLEGEPPVRFDLVISDVRMPSHSISTT